MTDCVKDLGDAFRAIKKKKPYKMIAFVILHEHLHVIWELPGSDVDYSRRWQLIKAHFTQSLIKSDFKLKKNERGGYKLWQKRFWEHRIRDENDLHQHIDYIHFNPVKHGLVSQPNQWPYSSLHRFIQQGLVDKNWGGHVQEGAFGE